MSADSLRPEPWGIMPGLKRPSLSSLRETILKCGQFTCPCWHGGTLTESLLFHHWRAGHFDIPIDPREPR